MKFEVTVEVVGYVVVEVEIPVGGFDKRIKRAKGVEEAIRMAAKKANKTVRPTKVKLRKPWINDNDTFVRSLEDDTTYNVTKDGVVENITVQT